LTSKNSYEIIKSVDSIIMGEKFIIAHDLGTTGNKATLFSSEGTLLKSVVQPYEVFYSNTNWVEQDPEQWWQAFCKTNKELTEGFNPALVEAVSFSGQMMGCVGVDKFGNVLRRALIWADMRAVKEEAEIREKISMEESSAPAKNLIFLPYLLGERSPRWNPKAKGAFVGLNVEHQRGDMVRAVVEGIAMNLKIILDVYSHEISINELYVLGGLAKGNVVCRVISEVFQKKLIKRKQLEEATSIGAAITAGTGSGLIHGFEAVEIFNLDGETIEPDLRNPDQYRRACYSFEQIYSALRPIYENLA
jgi:sugar (pentulose or hexulose) kinase